MKLPAVLLLACACLAAQTAEQGRAHYNRSCTICHGLDGAAGDRAPALAGERRFLRATSESMYEAIKNGIPGTLMPASPLKDDEIRAIVAYVRSLRATASDAPPKGDQAHGAEIFWGKAECGRCHMAGGKGGWLAPDLSSIGAERRLSAIRDALTKPRPFPLRGYRPARVVTKDGGTFRGVIKNEDNFSLQLLDTEGRLRLLDRSEVGTIEGEPSLAMPHDYDKRLTATEFEDLLAFLSRQASGARARRGR